jgi:hypothetical protein
VSSWRAVSLIPVISPQTTSSSISVIVTVVSPSTARSPLARWSEMKLISPSCSASTAASAVYESAPQPARTRSTATTTNDGFLANPPG